MYPAYFSAGNEKKRTSHGMLGVVVLAHAGALFAFATYQKVLPQPIERPIVVSFIRPLQPAPQVAPKPLPVSPAKPRPVVKPVARPVVPEPAIVAEPTEPQLEVKTGDSVQPSVPESDREQPPGRDVTTEQSPPDKVAQEPQQQDAPIEQPRFNADYLDNPAPAYPPLSRKLREEGRVLLRVRVDAGGHPAQVTLHESSGYPRLDERAADTVRRWKFQPARQGGQPVEAWVIVPIQFSLKG